MGSEVNYIPHLIDPPDAHRQPKQLTSVIVATGVPQPVIGYELKVRSFTVFGKRDGNTNNTGSVQVGWGPALTEQPLVVTAGAVIAFTTPSGQFMDLSELYLKGTQADGLVILYQQ